MQKFTLESVREEIELRCRLGADLADVEGDLIEETPGLSEEEKAALWLFAWSMLASGWRAEAMGRR